MSLAPRPCGCPGAGIVVDEDRHRAFHDLVEQQTGISYGQELNLATIQAARGARAGAVSSAALDERNRRAGKSTPGWRRKAHHAAAAARDEAMSRAATGAGPAWAALARAAVLRVAAELGTFTTDDVWDAGLTSPPEPRALGPVMAELIRTGQVERTGEHTPSRRRHATPMPVYRSTLAA